MQKNPIAIIGVSAVMPDAKDVQDYWQSIVDGKNSLKDVPADRWDTSAYYDPDPTTPDKTYCKRGGFLPEIDFDPMEFGLPPNILEVTDVSQMISLVVAKAALLDAGYYNAAKEVRERTGVVLGVGGGQKLITPLTARLQYPIWKEALLSSGLSDEEADAIVEKIKKAYIPWEENSFPGMLGNVIAGRIANRFDLGGMNCVVDAACASSLAAFKMAVSDLLEGRSDMMLTGGVDTDNSIFMYLCFSKTPAFSQREYTTPFDADADGMMLGEGVGMVVLKRLDDAVRDGDRIYAVVKGIGVSSDGKFKSIYAPRPAGQALALKRAYEDAGFSPATVGLVEAHGTGTAAGDPAEFNGLKQIFTAATDEKKKIALGSVKSQIGHTKAAAGAASMVKVALALHHKVLPPSIGVNEPNPKFGIDETPFYINTTTRPWIRSSADTPRRAGVSSFGFGGTNFHIVLEEYIADHNSPYRLHRTAESILLHAPSPQQLAQHIEQTLTQLQSDNFQEQFLNLVEQSKGAVPRTHARIGFVADSAADTVALLQAGLSMLQKQPSASRWSHPKGVHYQVGGRNAQQKVVALFPGQGSQYLEMGREAALNYPEVREAWAKMDALFQQSGRRPLSQKVFPPAVFNDQEREEQVLHLRQTENAQPAIGVMSYAIYKLLQKAGFQPDYTAGHSFGELTALWAGGVLDDDGYFKLIKARGEAMAPPPNQTHFDSGTMLAVQGDASQVQAEAAQFPQVTLANLNSPNQTILAGPTAVIKRAEAALSAKGYRTVNLPVSAAFHTPLVGHAQHQFAEAIESVPFYSPRLPVYANATGLPYNQEPIEIRQTLEAHILNPVYFRQQIEHIYRAGGYIFVEIGPKRVLSNLVSEILGDRPHVAIAINASSQKPDDRQLRDAVVQMRVAGIDLTDFDSYQTALQQAAGSGKKRLNVKLTGANYVSDKTRQAYKNEIENGFKIERTVTLAQTSNHPEETVSPIASTTAPTQSSAQQPSGINLGELQTAMLEVVGEKTGYPVEMLELEMDMEADLGIDSIKRVEILGAMQDRFPNLPAVQPEEMAELRTLGEIVDYLNGQMAGEADFFASAPASVNGAGAAPVAGSQTNGYVNGSRSNGVGHTAVSPTHTAPALAPWQGTVTRHEARLKSLPRPDQYHITLPAGHTAVITDDGSDVTSQVAAKLQANGWPVVVLSFPTSVISTRANLPNGVRRVALSDMNEDSLQDTLNQLGRIGAFVHVQPLTPVAPGQVVLTGVEQKLVKHVFLMAKYLQPTLTTAAQQGFAAFMTVARLDGAFGFGRDVPFNPLGSGLFGLTKSLNLEWPHVYCRAVDISRTLADREAAEAIVAELHDPNRLINEAGYSPRGRVTLSE
ncbi:MAG: acyltransferase domain-containing protein [Anaerolineales bacterium]|nr:acyltransferase domain-containing protein [Anaerolineales bacterium]